MQQELLPSTSEFIERIKNADQQAFGELYDQYSQMLYGIICRIVQQEEDAQNLLQDCFVKIWTKRMSFDESKGKLATWLINIARNTAIDYIRSKYYQQKMKTNMLNHGAHPDLQQRSWSMDIDAIGLKRITQQLDPKYREIIDWMYFEGLTQQEIAEQYQLPLGTVKTRARAAILELRTYFKATN